MSQETDYESFAEDHVYIKTKFLDILFNSNLLQKKSTNYKLKANIKHKVQVEEKKNILKGEV